MKALVVVWEFLALGFRLRVAGFQCSVFIECIPHVEGSVLLGLC